MLSKEKIKSHIDICRVIFTQRNLKFSRLGSVRLIGKGIM